MSIIYIAGYVPKDVADAEFAMNRIWSGLARIDNGQAFPEEEQAMLAKGYWSGTACERMSGEETAWEFLCDAAELIDEIEA